MLILPSAARIAGKLSTERRGRRGRRRRRRRNKEELLLFHGFKRTGRHGRLYKELHSEEEEGRVPDQGRSDLHP